MEKTLFLQLFCVAKHTTKRSGGPFLVFPDIKPDKNVMVGITMKKISIIQVTVQYLHSY